MSEQPIPIAWSAACDGAPLYGMCLTDHGTRTFTPGGRNFASVWSEARTRRPTHRWSSAFACIEALIRTRLGGAREHARVR